MVAAPWAQRASVPVRGHPSGRLQHCDALTSCWRERRRDHRSGLPPFGNWFELPRPTPCWAHALVDPVHRNSTSRSACLRSLAAGHRAYRTGHQQRADRSSVGSGRSRVHYALGSAGRCRTPSAADGGHRRKLTSSLHRCRTRRPVRMRRPLRPLPLRTSIVDGESLDSWIDALARRNQTGPQDVLRALGFDQPNHSTTQLVDHTALHPPAVAPRPETSEIPSSGTVSGHRQCRPSAGPTLDPTPKPTTTEASGA